MTAPPVLLRRPAPDNILDDIKDHVGALFDQDNVVVDDPALRAGRGVAEFVLKIVRQLTLGQTRRQLTATVNLSGSATVRTQ